MTNPEQSDIDVGERCQAVLRYVWQWRCTRKATHGRLCAQHSIHGALVPSRWEHWRNQLGVICCKPIPPYERDCHS